MNGTHVMIDLETWGTCPGCAIASIGAVAFRMDRPLNSDSLAFHRNIDSQSCNDAGLVINSQTKAWWHHPDRAEALKQLSIDPRPFKEVAEDFHDWYVGVGGEYPWSHGAGFDIPIWDYAVRKLGLIAPWDFRNVRDTRTLFHLARFSLTTLPRAGTHHNSLDDARHQALSVQRAFGELHS